MALPAFLLLRCWRLSTPTISINRCLTLPGSGGGSGGRDGGALQSQPCATSSGTPLALRQQFGNFTSLAGHIEALGSPGNCLDMNVDFVDTYACCCGACCCDCETWRWVPVGSDGGGDGGAMVSAENGQCVTELSPLDTLGGSYVTLVAPTADHGVGGRDNSSSSSSSSSQGSAAAVEFTTIIETMDNAESSCSYGNSGWNDFVVGEQPNNVTFCFDDLAVASCTAGASLPIGWPRWTLGGQRDVVVNTNSHSAQESVSQYVVVVVMVVVVVVSGSVARSRLFFRHLLAVRATGGELRVGNRLDTGGTPFPLSVSHSFTRARTHFSPLARCCRHVASVLCAGIRCSRHQLVGVQPRRRRR